MQCLAFARSKLEESEPWKMKRRRGCDPKDPQVTGDQKKRSEARRSPPIPRRGRADHRWITQRATTSVGRHARGRAAAGRETRKPERKRKESDGKPRRWRAFARIKTAPAPGPRAPRDAAGQQRTHARPGRSETCPVRRHTSGPRPVRPTQSIWADRIRFDTRHHLPLAPAAPAPLGWVDPVRPRKLWCGANRPRDAGAEERAKEESGCRSNNQRARRLAPPPSMPCGPLPDVPLPPDLSPLLLTACKSYGSRAIEPCSTYHSTLAYGTKACVYGQSSGRLKSLVGVFICNLPLLLDWIIGWL
jgi:hypothetical protein